LFKAWKSVAAAATRHSEPSPKPRRRRREETGGEFRKLAKTITRHFCVGREFGKAAQIMRRAVRLPAATMFLSDTLDWLNLWHMPAGGELDGDPDTAPNHLSPGL
jgi:hypothetical protein